MGNFIQAHRARLLMILVSVLGMYGSLGMAAEVVFQNGVNGYQGTADTYVHGYHQEHGSWEAVWNYGGSPVLQVRGLPESELASHKETALVRFDHLFGSGPNQIGQTAEITKATLLLYCTAVEDHPTSIEISQMTTPWIEGTKKGADATKGEVTGWYAGFDTNRPTAYWGRKKQPGVGPVSGIDYDNASNILTPKTAVKKSTWFRLDVTAFVKAWQTGAPNYGICLKPVQGGTWDGQTFASAQGPAATRPKLLVEYNAPESGKSAALPSFIPQACLARPIKVGPTLDGKLDDACWSASGWSDSFVCDPAGKKPSQETEFQVVHDAEALYLGIVCHEAQPDQLVSTISQRDGEVFRDDCVELFLMKDPAVRSYYHLAINAKGTKYDALDGDARVDLDWTAATRVEKDRWLVEVRIPFRALKKTPAAGDFWRLNIGRERKAAGAGKTDENSCWSMLVRGFHEPESFGHLVFDSYPPALGTQAAKVRTTVATVKPLVEKLSDAARVADQLNEVERSLTELAGRPATTAADYRAGLTTIQAAEESLRTIIAQIQKAPDTGSATARASQPIILSHLEPYEALDKDPNAQLIYATAAEKNAGPVTLRFAQAVNEFEHDAFVVSATRTVKGLRIVPGDLVAANGLRIPKAKIRCFQVGWITPLKWQPYYPQWNKIPNPDLLEELDGPITLDRLQSRHIWVTVDSFDVSPGVYKGAISCAVDQETQQVGIEVEVWPLRLPRRSPLDLYLFTNLPWAGRSGEAWARLFSEHYVSYIFMEQPSDAMVADHVIDANRREIADSDIPATVPTDQIRILGKRWDHRERLKIIRKYGMKVEFYCGKEVVQKLLPAYVRYLQDLGFSYADFRWKISDEDMDPGTLPIYKAYQRLDPDMRLVLCPAGKWDISPFRPYVDTYMCSTSVTGLKEWTRLFKLEQGYGKKIAMYTNAESWAGRAHVLSGRQNFWDTVWEYRLDEYTVWTMGVIPFLNYNWGYELQTPRPSMVNIPPENQSTAQLVYFRRRGDFFKPISCKRLESIRDGMKDYLYLSILERLVRQAQSEKKTQLANRGNEALQKALFLPKTTGQDFFQAKKLLAQTILELDRELNPYTKGNAQETPQ